MTFKYNVGLQNVGSYQVSGRPWCKHVLTTGAATGFIEFPSVTQNIHCHVDDGGTSATTQFAFCEPSRAVNMPNTLDYLSTSLSANSEYSLSLWFKFDTLADQRIVEFLDDNGLSIRVQSRNTTRLRIIIGAIVDDSAPVLVAGEWNNIVFSVSSNSQKLFFNGQFLLELTESISNIDTLRLGSNSVNFDGAYSTMFLFNKVLSSNEVSELYTTAARLHPSLHSAAENLVSHWATNDGAYGQYSSQPDTTIIVYDRVSSNDLSLSGGAMTFEDGFTIANALARHSATVAGHDEVTFPFKARRLLYSVDKAVNISFVAALTNIPSSRMFPLTGPGIDE